MISIKYNSGFMCALRELDKKEFGDEFFHYYGASVYEAIFEVYREFQMMSNLMNSSHGFCPRMTLTEGQAYAVSKYLDFMRGGQ